MTDITCLGIYVHNILWQSKLPSLDHPNSSTNLQEDQNRFFFPVSQIQLHTLISLFYLYPIAKLFSIFLITAPLLEQFSSEALLPILHHFFLKKDFAGSHVKLARA